MIAAFQKAVSQLSDPALRRVIWRTLLLAIVAYILVWGLSWFAIWSFTYFDIPWINTTIKYLGAFAVTILSLLLFPATFGMIISVFLEEIADIVVFDAVRVADRATFEMPFQYPEGISAVIVNGVPAVLHGERQRDTAGRTIRPSTHGGR